MSSLFDCCRPNEKRKKEIRTQIERLRTMIENADQRIAEYDNRMTKKSAEQEAYRSEAKKLRIQKKDLEVRTYLKKYKYARDAYTYLETFWEKYCDMKVLMDKQMNQLEYVDTAEDMIKALEDSKEFMENLNEMNAKIEDLSERVGEFDDAIDNDRFQLDDSELEALEASLGDSSIDEIIDYLKENLQRVAETVFSEMLVAELSSLFKQQYQQLDRLASMDTFLSQAEEKTALSAARTVESLSDLSEVMAFTDEATKRMVTQQVTTLLTRWATEDVLRVATESKLRGALEDLVGSHLAGYVEAVTRPGADARKSLLQLLESLSAEMAATVRSAWFEDMREHQAVSGFQTRMREVESAIRAKEKKEEAVKHTLDDLPPAPKVIEVVSEVSRDVSRDVNQSTSQPTNQPIHQPMHQPLHQPPTRTTVHIDLPKPPQTINNAAMPSAREVEVTRIGLPEPPKGIIFRVPPKSAKKAVAVME